jgi:hypothetical protein
MIRNTMVNETGKTMLVRIAAIAIGLVAVLPAKAGELKYDEAKRLIAGKVFSYQCFDGTTGAGRIRADGSVAGTIRMQGAGATRFVSFPAGTMHNRSGSICASVKGLFLAPCFRVEQVSEHVFRGSISGFSFAYCNFVGRGHRLEIARSGRGTEAAAAVPPRD